VCLGLEPQIVEPQIVEPQIVEPQIVEPRILEPRIGRVPHPLGLLDVGTASPSRFAGSRVQGCRLHDFLLYYYGNVSLYDIAIR
jgi:hypothetical protein